VKALLLALLLAGCALPGTPGRINTSECRVDAWGHRCQESPQAVVPVLVEMP